MSEEKKKNWFAKHKIITILIVLFVLGSIVSAINGNNNVVKNNPANNNLVNNTQETEKNIQYTRYEISDMTNDLKSNAMKAQNKYLNQYVEFSGKLDVIDSDGQYVSVRSYDDEYGFDSIHCSLKNNDQRNKIININKGDNITIKGKVKTVGELLGYHVDIIEIK